MLDKIFKVVITNTKTKNRAERLVNYRFVINTISDATSIRYSYESMREIHRQERMNVTLFEHFGKLVILTDQKIYDFKRL